MEKVRVRFAPSPTGYLHIGGLRTVLFNYLFAKHYNGDFILRIEDTDRSRYVEGAFEDIKESIKWLGITWDEGPDAGGDKGPYFQSERLDFYKKYAERLVNEGTAYKCFCTSERIQEIKEKQKASKEQIRYDKHCRNFSKDEVAKNEAADLPYVIRFKVSEEGQTKFEDYLRDEVVFENAQLDDFIILKTDGFPTYHLASVVDDHLMEITHVLRGEEWISSTPKHVLLYNALSFKMPEFVHLPVILSSKGGKLSKRDGATQVREFMEKGYLAEAMTNFLVLLGWSLDGSTSMFTMQELEKVFTLEQIGKNSPVFDIEKLNDYNGKYIREKSVKELADLCYPYMLDAGIVKDDTEGTRIYFESIMELLKERLVLLSDVVESAKCFFIDKIDYEDGSMLIPKKTSPDQVKSVFKLSLEKLEHLEDFSVENLENSLRKLIDELGLKAGQIFMALRITVTGSKVSPGLFETMSVLGKQRCMARIKDALAVLE
ncbi:MAG: glutamate--tRNA ligase [Spirochaetes bacterium]|nr:glutamate--tRNA ligase [Spirochaetota bacterium]